MERYNLRSGMRECHISVQLQLAGDEEFLMDAGQVLVSDSDHSDTSLTLIFQDFCRFLIKILPYPSL